MQTPNTFETYAEIDKSDFSSLQMVADELNEDLDSLTYNIEKKIAREYTRIKKEIFEDPNVDWKFCIFEGQSIKVVDTQGKTYYKPPTNFLRFLKTNTNFKNHLITHGYNKTFEMLAGSTFFYIGYIKDNDSNTYKQNAIPQEIKEAIAFKMLYTTFRKNTTSPIDIRDYYLKYSNSLANARLKIL